MLTLSTFQEYFQKHREEIFRDYFYFLHFRSIATDPAFSKETLACSAWLADYLKKSGLSVDIWETKGAPILLAHDLRAGPNKETLLLYGHYDVQPVDPIDLWTTPPFEPTVRDGNVFARGAVDNKGQCFYTIWAIKALLEKKKQLNFNLKLLIEGEEESGSHNLAAILPAKKRDVAADHVLVVDSGIEEKNRPAITLGVRGLVCMTLTLTGSTFDLHSGVHGGIVYNPNRALVELLASCHTPDGAVSIPGFYDKVHPVTPQDRANYHLAFDAENLSKNFGAKAVGMEKGYSPLESAWLRPTLEINGITGGYSGAGFKTVIPAKASAKISCRLVPDQEPNEIANLVKAYLVKHTPPGMHLDIEVHPGSGRAVRASPKSKIAHVLSSAFENVYQRPCDYILGGGSIPIGADLQEACGGDVLFVGVGLASDKIHAPDEHFGLDRFEQGFLLITQALQLLDA